VKKSQRRGTIKETKTRPVRGPVIQAKNTKVSRAKSSISTPLIEGGREDYVPFSVKRKKIKKISENGLSSLITQSNRKDRDQQQIVIGKGKIP